MLRRAAAALVSPAGVAVLVAVAVAVAVERAFFGRRAAVPGARLKAPAYVQRVLDDASIATEHKAGYAVIKRAYEDGTFRAEHEGLWALVKDGAVLPDGYETLASALQTGLVGCTAHQIGRDEQTSRAFYALSLGRERLPGSIAEPIVS